MDKKWKPVVVAVALGVVLPRLLLSAVKQKPQAEPVPTQQPTQQETHIPSLQATYLPVLTDRDSIHVLELEQYVLGVVMAEMPAEFEEEALKAQAVVARTYALRRLNRQDRHEDVAICTDSNCCQAYVSKEDYLQKGETVSGLEKIIRAVEATKGQVLIYDGELIEATYFSCSGGRTEDAVAVWGEVIPYLQAVDSPGEENAVQYWNEVHFTAEEFEKTLGRKLSGSPESWLGRRTFTPGDGVQTMVIGGITYTGTYLRDLLELNSTAFMMTAENGGITVETLGKGHRVGMSQYGADAMARNGSNYEEILMHYYQGTRIDKMENIL
ncbi:MAG: stage II sporulation protein D [Oscillospiraceae bacterium]|nr:stage II sporulation protein D [Oscillospiraceae bacterium]